MFVPSAEPSAGAMQALRRAEDMFVTRDARLPALHSAVQTVRVRSDIVREQAGRLSAASLSLERIGEALARIPDTSK